jgi:quercetin dioxygenase-like cupin family protein
MSDAHAPTPPAALYRARLDAPTLTVARLGVTIRTLVATAESGGMLAALEYTAPPGFRGPAPHWHARLTETFLGLDGAPVLRAGEAEHVLGSGAVVVVPPGVVHAFSNPGAAPARFLVLTSPGLELERYFDELAAQIGESATWPPTDPAVLDALSTIAARYDTFPPPAPAS